MSHKYLIISSCKNCERQIASIHHTKRCPYCFSYDLDHEFSQTGETPEQLTEFTYRELQEQRERFERVYQFYETKE